MNEEQAAAEAHNLRNEILEILEAQAGLELVLAKVIHEVRNTKIRERPWWSWLSGGAGGWDSEKEFVSATISAGGLNTRLNKIEILDRCYRIFVGELGLTPAQVMRVGFGKLDVIRGILQREPDTIAEWLLRAEMLSLADLIAEKQRHLGREDREPKRKKPVTAQVPGLELLDKDVIERGDALWWALVGETACVAHPDNPAHSSDRAHFPGTKAAGEKFIIPMCRTCHSESEGREDEWLAEHKRQVWGFVRRVISAALARADELGERNDYLAGKLRELEEGATAHVFAEDVHVDHGIARGGMVDVECKNCGTVKVPLESVVTPDFFAPEAGEEAETIPLDSIPLSLPPKPEEDPLA